MRKIANGIHLRSITSDKKPMTTEDLLSQLSQIIRSPSEMHKAIRVEGLTALIAAGIALLAMVTSILGQSNQRTPATKQRPTIQSLIQSKTGAISTSTVPITENPNRVPRFAMVFLVGGCVLIFSVPLSAIWACLQNGANESLRERADKTANWIMDAWTDPAGMPLRANIAAVAKTWKVEVDDEKVERILAVLGTCAIDPSVWGEARGSLRVIKIP